MSECANPMVKSVTELVIQCDKCGAQLKAYGVTLAWTHHNIRQQRWTITPGGVVHCPKCKRVTNDNR